MNTIKTGGFTVYLCFGRAYPSWRQWRLFKYDNLAFKIGLLPWVAIGFTNHDIELVITKLLSLIPSEAGK